MSRQLKRNALSIDSAFFYKQSILNVPDPVSLEQGN